MAGVGVLSVHCVHTYPADVTMATISPPPPPAPTVNFQPTNYTVLEGDTVLLVLVLDKIPARRFSVSFVTVDGTASSGCSQLLHSCE